MSQFHIQFLGGFELRDQDGSRLSLPSRNAAALLAILATSRGRMQSRTKLATLLWDACDFEHARGSLRQTLFMLRRVLGREAFREQTDALRLDESTIHIDIWGFTDAAQKGTPEALRSAGDLYQGEFLEGHRTGKSIAFDEWLSNEQQRFRDGALRVLGELLDVALRLGAHDDARGVAMRMLAIDSAEEVAHRALMQIHASEQRFGQAIRQFETCRQTLWSELNVEPDAQTQQLHADILRARSGRGMASAPGRLLRTEGLRKTA